MPNRPALLQVKCITTRRVGGSVTRLQSLADSGA
jgi:hypothetical protein